MDFRNLLSYARQQLPDLEIKGLHYAIAPSQCRRGDVPWICFDVKTNNPLFFGRTYNNTRRIKILDRLYEKLATATENLGSSEAFLDFYAHLEEPYKEETVETDDHLTQGVVDVTSDNAVRFVPLKEAIQRGDIQSESAIEQCCRRYGIEEVLMHGFHTIAPDPSTAKAFGALLDMKCIESALEIGGGVGTTGRVAEDAGLTDFTFVDMNKDVCRYLEEKLPYQAINQSAFDFEFKRDYDAVVLGVPYELVPHLLQKKGGEISDHTDTLIIQSGLPAFFEFEHDWAFGNLGKWSWHDQDQTVQQYFNNAFEGIIGYQTIIVANHKPSDDMAISMRLEELGMEPVRYQYVVL